MPRRQALSHMAKQARPRMPGNGSFSRTTATASPYLPSAASCTYSGTLMPAGQAALHGTIDASRFAGSSVRSRSAPVGHTVTQALQNLQPDSTRVGSMVAT